MLPPLYVILDRTRYQDAAWLLTECCEGGARLFVWRDKQFSVKDYREALLTLLSIARGYGARVLAHGHVDVASELAGEVAGLHVTGAQLGELSEVRKRIGGRALLAASLHSEAEVALASQRLDFATISPVFETASKPGYGPALGEGGVLASVAASGGVPLYALGGVTPERLVLCRAWGAAGGAVMGGICHSDDPRAATRRYLR